MGLRDDVKTLIEYQKKIQATLDHDAILFDIFEGNLLPHVLEDLKRQLNESSYEQCKHRVPPINVLRRIVDKLSKIYLRPPVRAVVDGDQSATEAIKWYTDSCNFDDNMAHANKLFNLSKKVALEPFLDAGKPCLRSIPSDRFFVYSFNSANPTKPTHFVKIMGTYKDGLEEVTLFYAYTDTEFLIYDSKEKIRDDLMSVLGNPTGTHDVGRIPFVYINRSKHNLVPPPDTDTLAMTKLIPILLADANFASMYQSFSIIYGINVDDKNLKMSPNAFWSFKSDDPEAKGSIGVIKPEADSDKQLNLIKAQLAMWMDSRNIKPGSVGNMTVDNASSGIAKMIDESDTTEDRKEQTTYFSSAEIDLFDLVINHMHNVWINEPGFDPEYRFMLPGKFKFTSQFPEQLPIADPSAQVDEEIKKMENGLTTRRRALKSINPDMSDEAIDELLADIEKELPELLQLRAVNKPPPGMKWPQDPAAQDAGAPTVTPKEA